MELVANPVDTAFYYRAVFQEPIFHQLKENERLSLLGRLAKVFDLRVSDIRFDTDALATRWLSFSKFVNPGFFDVSFGIEEISSSFRNPSSEGQILDFQNSLYQLSGENPISLQRMTLQQQLASDGDVTSFLETLNPHTPDGLKGYLIGKGVIYDLEIEKHNLRAHLNLSHSHFVEGGLFLYFEVQFSPNIYDFLSAFNIAKQHFELVLEELKLTVKRDT